MRRATDRGVSPVIGTILMVAVVVILAAVIGGFVFGFGSPSEQPPATSITITSERIGDGIAKNDAVVLEHQAGETFGRGRITVTIGPDEVFNSSIVEDIGGDGSVGARLQGLVVQVDPGPYNDLNKPGSGPPGQADGDSANVVVQWGDGIDHGDRLVIQERNAGPAYDVIQEGERVRVVWTDESGQQFLLASATVGDGS
jgi:flagellin-like protein